MYSRVIRMKLSIKSGFNETFKMFALHVIASSILSPLKNRTKKILNNSKNYYYNLKKNNIFLGRLFTVR
jgi:hypothetical protein